MHNKHLPQLECLFEIQLKDYSFEYLMHSKMLIAKYVGIDGIIILSTNAYAYTKSVFQCNPIKLVQLL